MQVNQISFGKIVKVNGTHEIARQIEDIANGKRECSGLLKRDVNKLFSDVKIGRAYTFKFDKISSYIFSGEEGKKYWESCCEAIDKIRNVKDSAVTIEQREARTASIWDSHMAFVYDLINKHGIDNTLDPSISKHNTVKTLNIVR